ncbi:MAG: AAA family ATPase [Thermodesulfobacteria bacterium]|nr:AAA family ATPase [Thermodesulfobacteriota bacterium]
MDCINLIVYWTSNLILHNPKVVDRFFNIISKLFSQKFEEVDDYEVVEDEFSPIEGGYSHNVKRDYLMEPDQIKKQILTIVKDKYEEIRKNAWNLDFYFLRNLNYLAKTLGLSEEEKECIAFLVIADNYPEFSKLIQSAMFDSSLNAFLSVLHIMTKIPLKRLKQIFSLDSHLIESGLVQIEKGFSFAPISEIPIKVFEELSEVMFYPFEDPDKIFSSFLNKPSQSRFTLKDFSHIDFLEVLVKFLKGYIESPTPGQNILIYGPPGVGKTQLSKTLAKELGLELYEISLTKRDQKFRSEMQRLAVLNLAYRFLKNRKDVIILFDEADDILKLGMRNISILARDGEPSINKSILNRTLENSPILTIWISNSLEDMDPVYLRRFTLILKMDYPPRKARLYFINKYLKNFNLSKSFFEKLADYFYLTPAILEKVSNILERVEPLPENSEKVVVKLLNSSLQALGLPPIEDDLVLEKGVEIPGLPSSNPNFSQILKQLQMFQKQRLLFFGPKGAGKEYLAKKLAFELEKEYQVINTLFSSIKDLIVECLNQKEKFLIIKNFEKLVENSQEFDSKLFEELMKMSPAEVIVITYNGNPRNLLQQVKGFTGKVRFEFLSLKEKLLLMKEMFGVKKVPRESKEILKEMPLVIEDFIFAKKRINRTKEKRVKYIISILKELSQVNQHIHNIGFIKDLDNF